MLLMSKMPILSTNRLLLRPLSIEDAPRITQLLQEPDIAINGLGIPQPYQLSDAEHMIERVQQLSENDHFTWAIVLHENNELLGVITLILTTVLHRAEMGYWIGKEYWNNGYATEAAKFVIKDAYSRYEINRIYAKSFTDNEASTRVLEKIGMQYEGLLRKHVWHPMRNKSEDTFIYSILKDEIDT